MSRYSRSRAGLFTKGCHHALYKSDTMLIRYSAAFSDALSFARASTCRTPGSRRRRTFFYQMLGRRRGLVLLASTMLCTWSAVGKAQIATDARVGVDSRLRIVTHSGQVQEALFVSESPDNLVVRYECGPECNELSTVPWDGLERVEVFALHGHSGQRAFFHALAGGVISVALTLGADAVVASRGPSGQLGVAVAAPYVVAVGVGAGFLHGWGQQDGWWERVWAAPAIAK
ncbi:hypothetical protein BH09GEM1_BH09GEM1_39360 [soil metagenome]